MINFDNMAFGLRNVISGVIELNNKLMLMITKQIPINQIGIDIEPKKQPKQSKKCKRNKENHSHSR